MRLIYLSPVPFHSFSQRPHELVKYFHACTDGTVLWIDPYPTRLPNLSDFFRHRDISGSQCNSTPPWVTVVKPSALPIEPLPLSRHCNSARWKNVIAQVEQFSNEATILGIGKPSVLALALIEKKRFIFSFYDAMDDFPAFYSGFSRMAMIRREKNIIHAVSTVMTSSSYLYSRLKNMVDNVKLVPNACAPECLPIPPHRKQKAVVGYVGTVAKWFDWRLFSTLASAYPSLEFRLIGPLYSKPPRRLASNVSLHNALPHAQAAQEMAKFDVGLIPFKKTRLTASVDPIKYYEYRSLGLPVLSASFGEMSMRANLDGVFIIENERDSIRMLEQALDWQLPSMLAEDFRKENSWQNRFRKAGLFIS